MNGCRRPANWARPEPEGRQAISHQPSAVPKALTGDPLAARCAVSPAPRHVYAAGKYNATLVHVGASLIGYAAPRYVLTRRGIAYVLSGPRS